MLAAHEDESTSQSANSLLSFGDNLPQWRHHFAVPTLRDHNTGWPSNTVIHMQLDSNADCSQTTQENLMPDVAELEVEQQVKTQDGES